MVRGRLHSLATIGPLTVRESGYYNNLVPSHIRKLLARYVIVITSVLLQRMIFCPWQLQRCGILCHPRLETANDKLKT